MAISLMVWMAMLAGLLAISVAAHTIGNHEEAGWFRGYYHTYAWPWIAKILSSFG